MTGDRKHPRGLGRPLVNSARRFPAAIRVAWLILVIALWWITARFGLVSSLIVPSPEAVAAAAGDIGGTLLVHSLATLLRGGGGFLLGAMLGTLLGILVQYSRTARFIAEPLMDASRPVPVVALLPFFILIFGFREEGRIVLIVLNIAIFTSLAMVEALARVPEPWVRFARVSGMSRWQIFRRILVRGSLPFLAGPFRLALALSFTLTIASEFMGAQEGLGFLINTARVNLATPTIWLAILMIGLLCQAADMLLVRFFRRTTIWYQTSD